MAERVAGAGRVLPDVIAVMAKGKRRIDSVQSAAQRVQRREQYHEQRTPMGNAGTPSSRSTGSLGPWGTRLAGRLRFGHGHCLACSTAEEERVCGGSS